MSWLLAPLLLPFATAVLCLLFHRQVKISSAIGVLGSVAQLIGAIGLFTSVYASGHVVIQGGNWPAPFGITLVADMLSALMVGVTAVIGLAVSIYSLQDIPTRLKKSHYFALFHFLLLGVNGAFITGDLFNLYVWFEVMLLASFVLITMGGEKDQLEGGVKYLIINLLSSILFLSGVGILYGKLGTLNMADIALRMAESPDAILVNSSAMLLLVAFAIKAALFPFFFWLPASYHTPAVAISALFAGLLTKVGIYAFFRSYTLIFNSQFEVVQTILLFLAGATMIVGVLGAAAQFEIRKILSFHIVSQIGYILMGLAISSSLALTAAVFYTLHHILVKANLFLISGLISRRCGTSDLKFTGGLYASAPLLSILFFIPAFSLGGIPPLSGFWAKFGLVQAGIEGGYGWLVTAALLVGVLTLYSMTKIWQEAFWKNAPTDDLPKDLKSSPLTATLVVPCAVLALLTVGIGLWSQPLMSLAEIASDQMLSPQTYIDAVLNNPSSNDLSLHP